MTCNQAQELLPWLLNGSLETAERDEVRGHLATCEACRAALAATREAWEVFDQHIPSADLVSLAWGERPTGVDPALAEAHLADCPRCAAEIELARMSRRLEEEGNVALFQAVKPKTVTGAAPRTWRAAAIAASLAAVVASSGWLYTAQQAGVAQVAQVSQAETGLSLPSQPQGADIVMLDAVVRGGAEGATARAGAYSTLLFPAPGATGQGTAEIVDEAGKVVRRVSDLNPTQGSYALVLPPGALPPGRYTVRLNGQDPVGSFRVVP